MEEGMAIEHGMVTRSIERGQKKVEDTTSKSASTSSNTTR